jgi:hypothetical protein
VFRIPDRDLVDDDLVAERGHDRDGELEAILALIRIRTRR